MTIDHWDLLEGDRPLEVTFWGDRYSKPTTRNHNDTGKIPAICDDTLPSSQANDDLSRLVQLPNYLSDS